MDERPMSLELGEAILRLLRDSGATQIEQYAALDVARALVPVSGSSLTASGFDAPRHEGRSQSAEGDH